MRAAKNFQSGDHLGRYELVFQAGKGGMGQVWAAKLRGDQGFRKIVALKTLLANEAFSEEMQRMLRDEAMLASHIKNPHVAETLDFGLHDGVPYLVMEWVDGESLADLLQQLEGPMPLRHVVAIANQVLKGLEAAHNARDATGKPLGIVHRDVSPPNILISFSGSAKLADFGIAQVSGDNEVELDKGLKGKFSFMAPEQIKGEPLDARTDVFAMGVLLYRLVTNRYPFAGADVGETLWQISSSITPRSPCALNEALPPRVADVILKALEKEPADRYQSAEEMRQAIERTIPPNIRGDSEAAIAELMAEKLGDRMEERRRRTARALLSVPPTATDAAVTPSISTLKGLTYTTPPSEIATVVPLPAASRRRGLMALGIATAALAALGVSVVVWRAQAEPAGEPLAQVPELAAPEPAAATTAAVPLDEPALPAEPEASATAPEPTASNEPPQPRIESKVRPRTNPRPRKDSKQAATRAKSGARLDSAADLKSPY